MPVPPYMSNEGKCKKWVTGLITSNLQELHHRNHRPMTSLLRIRPRLRQMSMPFSIAEDGKFILHGMIFPAAFEAVSFNLMNVMEYNFSENPCPVPQGILLVIGGKEDKGDSPEDKDENRLAILKNFVQLTGKQDPNLELVTSASGEPDETFGDYQKVFEKLGVKCIAHIHHRERQEVLNDDLTDRVNNADAVFFTGGDQLMLTSLYGGSNFLMQLKQRYIADRIVIGGTSAGAMALSTPMIYAGNKDKQQVTGEIKITTGLEFLKDVCIDTHFIDRSRFVRMAQVIATNPCSIGIGIEEDTAIIVRDGIEAEVIGNGLITVIEGFDIASSNITDFDAVEKVNIQNMKVHLLSKGSHYHIQQINPPHK